MAVTVMRAISMSPLHQVDEGWLGAIGLAPVKETGNAIALSVIELLGRREVAREFIVHRMEPRIERRRGLGGVIGNSVMRRRVAFVIATRLRLEAGRERFARFRRHEGLRRARRSYSLFVALRDGALGNAAWLESARGRRHDVLRCNAPHPVDDGGHLGGRWPTIALVGVVFLPRRDLEQREQEILARRGVALVERLVVPAAFAVAAGRDASLPQRMWPRLARRMGDGEGIFDGDHVVVVEHGAAGFGLEDHDPMPAEQGRYLLEDVAHGGVAVAVEFILAAPGDDVHLVHDGGDRRHQGGRGGGHGGWGEGGDFAHGSSPRIERSAIAVDWIVRPAWLQIQGGDHFEPPRVGDRGQSPTSLIGADFAIPDDTRRIRDRLIRSGLGFAGKALQAAVRVIDDGDKTRPNAAGDGCWPGGDDLLHRQPPGPGTSVADWPSSARRQVRVSPASNASRDAIIMMATRLASWGVAATWLSSTSSALERVRRRSPTPLRIWTGIRHPLRLRGGARGHRSPRRMQGSRR